jgi:hypothetical protein
MPVEHASREASVMRDRARWCAQLHLRRFQRRQRIIARVTQAQILPPPIRAALSKPRTQRMPKSAAPP